MSSSVQITFDANTGSFVANVDGATASVQKSAEAVAKAKNAVLQWGQQSIATAKEAGASSEQLAAIQERTASRLVSISEKNANRVVAALDRQQQKAREVAAEMANLDKVVDITTGRSALDSFTERQRSAAVVRALSGRSSLRTAESAASAIPGFAALSDIVFPVAAAGAFVTVVAEGVERLKEMYDTAQRIPDSIRDMFESVNAPILQNVDTLRRDNDQLEITIAHLEHKPANNLALALDEARLNADKLTQSADKAFSEVSKLMQQNHVGLFQFALTGQIGTGPVEDEITKRMQAYRDLAQANRDALHSGTDTPQAAQARSAQMQAALRDMAKWAHQSRTDIQSFDTTGQQKANINLLEGVENYANDTLDEQTEQDRNVSNQGTLKKLQGDKQAAGDINRAAEQQLKALEDYINVWKTQAPVSAKAIFDFWEDQKASFAHAPQELQQINTKLAELATEGARAAHEAITKYKTEAARNEGPLFSPRALNVEGNTAETGRALSDEASRNAQATAQMNAELARTKVAIDLANGSINKLTADQRLAAISADEHAQRLAILRDQLADFQKNANSYNSVLGLYTNDKEQQQYVGLTASIAKETGAQQIDAMSNSAKVAGDTWLGALKKANAEWVQDSQDSAKQVTDLFRTAVNGLKDDIASLMVGEKSNFANTFRSIGKMLAGDSLRRMESALFEPQQDSDSDSQAPASGGRKALGGIFGALGSVMGLFGSNHRAVGGDVSAGMAYDVGEMGRELFVPKTDGTIIPHSALSGGGVHYSVNVANGVTPEQMNMHVQEALRQFHPQVVRDSVAAAHDYQRRNPASRR